MRSATLSKLKPAPNGAGPPLKKLFSPLLLSYAAAVLALVLFERLAHTIQAGETILFDRTVREFVHGFASPSVTVLMRTLTEIGTVPVTLLATAVICLVLWYRGLRSASLVFAVTEAGAVPLMYLLKILFHRQRPEAYFGYPLPHNYSFPSGHALGAFCFWGVLAVILSTQAKTLAPRIAIWSIAVFMALGIGLSRIYLGVHYPSDVLGGYLAGLVWVSGVGWVYRHFHRRSEAASSAR